MTSQNNYIQKNKMTISLANYRDTDRIQTILDEEQNFEEVEDVEVNQNLVIVLNEIAIINAIFGNINDQDLMDGVDDNLADDMDDYWDDYEQDLMDEYEENMYIDILHHLWD